MTMSPRHVAFIMDGNGRWAQQNRFSRAVGHKRGVEAFKHILKACRRKNIPYVTAYAFSSENWRRPVSEVNHLLSLFEHYLEKEQEELLEQNIRLKVIGERERMPPRLLERIDQVEKRSEGAKQMTLQIAFNYGGRAELVHASKKLAQAVQKGLLSLDDINESTLSQFLYTTNIPDPDLLIRTSGEQRISNYLLWQLAYAEFIFVDKYWPDFTEQDLESALNTFQGRNRRFGKAA